MRIALVSDTYTPQVNGVTTVLRRIVQAIGAARHHAAVVAPDYPNLQPDTRANELRVPSVAFPPYPAIRLSLPVPRRVAHFLDRFEPDLVHVATEGPLGILGRRYALRRGIPLVTSFHTNFAQYCRHYGVGALEPAVWRFLKWFHGPALLTQTPGEAVSDTLRAHGIRRPVVWGRGVDTARYNPARRDRVWRRRLGAADGSAIVLHVGRLAPEKNLDVLVEAWTLAHGALGSRALFVIAGDGPGARDVALRMPWALHFGFLSTETLSTLYASAELCVLPSATETCGLVALEAMASGLPVVAADAGGFRETVEHGRNGVLVAPADSHAFAAAISDLVLHPSARAAMGAAARATAVARDSA
ncbi:MAG: glycosyltransferase family 1 protein, partial [Gemmatimonadota bacterium]